MWFAVINGDATPCPPYAAAEAKSIDQSAAVVTIGPPSADGSAAIWFNGPTTIPPGAQGQVTSDLPAIAAYQADNAAATDPVHGETWGTVSGSWYLHKGKAGFQIVGAGGYGLCNVVASPIVPAFSLVFKTIDYTAVAWQHVVYDISGADRTMKFPASPALGDRVRVGFSEATGGHHLTLDGNGVNVNGGSLAIGTATTYYGWQEWVYVGGTAGWSPSGALT